jgi:hypothetical protein
MYPSIPLATPNDVQLDFVALILAITINEDGQQRAFPMSANSLRMVNIPAALRGVGTRLGWNTLERTDEWCVAIGVQKVVYADVVSSFVLTVVGIGMELRRAGG